MIPSYIKTRIKEIPANNMRVVNGSTPVIGFGNIHKSRIATLGLNPSKLEFLDKNGIELTESKRRLETLQSLNLTDRRNMNDEQVQKIWEGCNYYFEKNPYAWFKKLEKILNFFQVSYYSGTACHLDLVQWATDPVWRDLSPEVKRKLIQQDIKFLNQQLSNENIEILLLNGRSVINEFQKAFKCNLVKNTKLTEGRLPSEIYTGNIYSIKVIAWSINLQSSFGVTNSFIHSIGETIYKL